MKNSMMDELNIDKIFKEKLEGFSEDPPAFLWENVSAGLAENRRRKRTMLYARVAAASLLAMALVAGWLFYDVQKAELPQIAESEKINTEIEQKTESAKKTEISSEEQHIDEGTQVSGQFLAEATPDEFISYKSKEEEKPAIVTREVILPGYVALTGEHEMNMIASIEPKIGGEKHVAETLRFAEEKTEVLPEKWESDLIAENVRTQSASAKRDHSGWKLGVNVSPGYSSYTAKHDADYAGSMTYQENEGNANLSGGFSVQYKTGKKIRLESGVYYAQNGKHSGISSMLAEMQPQSEMFFASGDLYFNVPLNLDDNQLMMNSTAGVVEFENLPEGAEVAGEMEVMMKSATPLLSQGELSQVFDFVEIPLYVRYLLLDRKIGIELMGGVNAGVVVGNKAYLDNEYGMQNVGKTRDISAVNVLSTVGVGVNYALSKNISIAVEPRLNYYLNSINQNRDVDFRPYRIGIYTGLYYEF